MLAIWTLTFLSEIGRFIAKLMSVSNRTLFVSLVMTMCVVFMVSAYIILHHETTRHRKMIKAQQLPQEEVDRFTKESKALMTTVFVVGAVTISFLPIALHILASTLNKKHQLLVITRVLAILNPLVRTFAMLNSLLNPLIYCLRKKEMRKFVFRLPSQAVHPVN